MLVEKLITYINWDWLDGGCIQYYDCIFQQSIGCFEQGQRVPILCFDPEKAQLIAYDEQSNITQQQSIKLVAV